MALKRLTKEPVVESNVMGKPQNTKISSPSINSYNSTNDPILNIKKESSNIHTYMEVTPPTITKEPDVTITVSSGKLSTTGGRPGLTLVDGFDNQVTHESINDTDGVTTNSDGTITDNNTINSTLTYSDDETNNTIKQPNDMVNVTEMDIDSYYFLKTNVVNRQKDILTYTFEYLSYIFFEINIDENIPSFYNTIDTIIKDNLFIRDEDTPLTPIPEEDKMDNSTMALIFGNIWELAKATNKTGIMNLIGFYIYFNRRLNFLPILIKGTSINDFIINMSIESIINNLTLIGLYPINNTNLFNRLWNSYTYSVKEDSNKAEIKMSLREYNDHNNTKNINETYEGFSTKIDHLMMIYDLDMKKYTELKSFKNNNSAFKAYKIIIEEYLLANPNIKDYLKNILPKGKNLYTLSGLVTTSDSLKAPNKQLWDTLESFTTIYKVNRLLINKQNMENLFIEFAQDPSFPLGSIEGNNYSNIWLYWIQYLNNKALTIINNLIDATDPTHNYNNIIKQLIDLINTKYIIQYLSNNNTFSELNYTDNYTDAALIKLYESLDELKKQIKDIIKYTTTTDRRFKQANSK